MNSKKSSIQGIYGGVLSADLYDISTVLIKTFFYDLDDYVIDVITDRTLQLKLIASKFKKHNNEHFADCINLIVLLNRYADNSRIINLNSFRRYYDALQDIYFCLDEDKKGNFLRFLNNCENIFISNNISFVRREIINSQNNIPYDSSDSNCLLHADDTQTITNELEIHKIRELYGNNIKGRKLQIVEGSYSGEIAEIESFHGTKVKIFLYKKNKSIMIPISKKVIMVVPNNITYVPTNI